MFYLFELQLVNSIISFTKNFIMTE